MALDVVENLVALFELLLLQLLVGKGLDNPHAQKAVLHLGVDFTQLDALDAELLFHLAVEIHRRDDDEGHDGEHNQGKPHVDPAQDDEGADNLDARDEEFLGAVVGELRHVEQVGGDAGHNLGHLGVVEVVKGQLLQVVEHSGAHICPYFGAHDVAHGGHEEVGRGVHQAQE